MVLIKSFNSDTDGFKKAFALSAALHLLIIILFVLKFIFFSKPLIDLSQAISVSIGEVQPMDKLPPKFEKPESVEEDSPQEKKVAQPKLEKIVKKVEIPKPKDSEISLKKSKLKQKEALNKLKKQSALEKIKLEMKSETSNAKTPRVKNYKPRVIAAGTALGGLDKLEANNYLSQIDQNIKQAWTLPQWLLNKPFKTQVLVKFNTLGNIISTKIISSSGNSSYDDYCLQAVNKAVPFPKVPDKFAEKFSIDGIVIGFPE